MNIRRTYLTPGPSELYFTVQDHIRAALRDQIPSISHRSATFQSIFRETRETLSELLDIPDNFHIFFTASATEIWERTIQNLVEEESYHLINGAFSSRFFKIAMELGRNPQKIMAPDGQVVDLEKIMLSETYELISITHNETSTGAMHTMKDLGVLRKAFPEQLIAVDAVSSIPCAPFDFNDFDSLYFSVQKAFGLPAGLGVWIVNDRCMAKAESMLMRKRSVGSYHSLPSLWAKALKDQTPETPNVLGIYLLGKVARDMITRGIKQIRNETGYKSAVIYNAVEGHPTVRPFVQKKENRSQTVIVLEVDGDVEELQGHLAKNGLVVGTGYGDYADKHIRIANFPAHSKEQFEMLADLLKDY
ncbi:aminotransferase class V-fold PLP-dependent enzyme [Roseivirga sp. BDSF3-8]|uniref:aminotransferase class V-fold PLP-dependent enzyme n=1 Tax=Roseivirga sp. BDSF3-8 TaxID=3241598 RepID=UPI0035322B92